MHIFIFKKISYSKFLFHSKNPQIRYTIFFFCFCFSLLSQFSSSQSLSVLSPMCLSASCVASWNALLLLKMELWSCYRNTMVRTHLLFLFFFSPLPFSTLPLFSLFFSLVSLFYSSCSLCFLSYSFFFSTCVQSLLWLFIIRECMCFP